MITFDELLLFENYLIMQKKVSIEGLLTKERTSQLVNEEFNAQLLNVS